MASTVLLRALRRAAPSAALGSGGAAGSTRRFYIASRPLFKRLASDSGGSPVAEPPRKSSVRFVAEPKDLESDEALWALYERWCKEYGEERDRDEMRRRFPRFKETVLLVDRHNREISRTSTLAINRFADGKRKEQIAIRIRPRSLSPAPASGGNRTNTPSTISWPELPHHQEQDQHSKHNLLA